MAIFFQNFFLTEKKIACFDDNFDDDETEGTTCVPQRKQKGESLRGNQQNSRTKSAMARRKHQILSAVNDYESLNGSAGLLAAISQRKWEHKAESERQQHHSMKGRNVGKSSNHHGVKRKIQSTIEKEKGYKESVKEYERL